jgi:hypothetical protein
MAMDNTFQTAKLWTGPGSSIFYNWYLSWHLVPYKMLPSGYCLTHWALSVPVTTRPTSVIGNVVEYGCAQFPGLTPTSFTKHGQALGWLGRMLNGSTCPSLQWESPFWRCSLASNHGAHSKKIIGWLPKLPCHPSSGRFFHLPGNKDHKVYCSELKDVPSLIWRTGAGTLAVHAQLGLAEPSINDTQAFSPCHMKQTLNESTSVGVTSTMAKTVTTMETSRNRGWSKKKRHPAEN